MRALVTGGGGFLGRYLVEQLVATGHEVSVLCRGQYPALEALPITLYRGSVNDRELVSKAVTGQDWVFHTAAKVGYWGRYDDYFRTNVEGTRLLLAEAQAAGVRKFIYTSSPSVVMNNRDIHNGTESLPYAGEYLTPYSATKAIAESEILAANDPSGTQTTAIRPHLIIGPRDNHLLPRLIDKARRGRLRQIGPGTNRVSVCYVENGAHAHVLAALSNQSGGKAYFINEPEPIVLWQWVKQMLPQIGVNRSIRAVPFQLAYGAGYVLEQLYSTLKLDAEPLVTRFIASELFRNHYFSIERARTELGYEPIVPFAEAEEKLMTYLRELVTQPLT